MGYSKIVYGGRTLIDLTSDTVVADKMLSGYTAHGADGDLVTGSCTFDADTSDATAADSEILTGKIAYVKGTKKTGTMKNNGGVSGTISTKDGAYTVPQGYHDGSGKVQIDATEKSKLVANNIRAGVTILGVEGTMSSTEGANPQAVSVIPSTEVQTVLPDTNAGYNFISQVTVAAIPYEETDNSAGGKTVTIA